MSATTETKGAAMSNPRDAQRKHHEHELDVETAKDLEPKKGSAEAVRGGKRQHQPIKTVKEVDQASPTLH
jgi:type VI protein secretion system component Hcp